MDPSTIDIDEIWLLHNSSEKILSLMAEESVYKLDIGREYLPELLHEDILEISSDGLPRIKSFALRFFVSRDLQSELYENKVIFSLPDQIRRSNIEKISKIRKKWKKEREDSI